MSGQPNILFIRNRPKVFNLGDFLCTPKYYFDFFCNDYESAYPLKGKEYKIVLGGGAYNDLGVSQKVNFNNTVLWGVGSSRHGEAASPTQGDNLPFLLYGLRDPDAVSDPQKVLPCVSCLHPLVALPPGDQTNLIFNFDPGVTDLCMLEKDDFFRSRGLKVFSNYLNEIAFMKIFAKTRRIITNSYHVSYWALLSGREVAIIGYSSKFRSLVKLFNLDPGKINHYDVKDKASLKSVVASVLEKLDFYHVSDSEFFRKSFAKRNLDFAQKCKDIGFIKDFRLRPNRWINIAKRNIKYQVFQSLANSVNR